MPEAEPLELIGQNEVRWRNRTLVHFSGCDYFRLARHPEVVAAAARALEKHGVNVAASRVTTGNRKLFVELEHKLAAFFGAESAVIVPDGYLAPIAAAQAVSGDFSHAFIDECSHAALVDASRMLACPVKMFPHRDVAKLARLLAKLAANARPILLTDGMFSHDGAVSPLAEYLKILPRTGMILVDDAHAAGVLGAKGRGSVEHAGVNRARIIHCATLSKAFGAYGGIVLGSGTLREKIVTLSPAFAGSTPLPPPLASAALASLRILKSEPERRKRLSHNVSHLRVQLRKAGWEISETPGPIVRLPILNFAEEKNLKRLLLNAGIYPPYFKYGRASTAGFFRFVISSEHTQPQLDKLARVLAEFMMNGKDAFAQRIGR